MIQNINMKAAVKVDRTLQPKKAPEIKTSSDIDNLSRVHNVTFEDGGLRFAFICCSVYV